MFKHYCPCHIRWYVCFSFLTQWEECVVHMISYLDEFRNRTSCRTGHSSLLALNYFLIPFFRPHSNNYSFDSLRAAKFYEILIAASKTLQLWCDTVSINWPLTMAAETKSEGSSSWTDRPPSRCLFSGMVNERGSAAVVHDAASHPPLFVGLINLLYVHVFQVLHGICGLQCFK